MPNLIRFDDIIANIRALGVAKLSALVVSAFAIIATVVFGSYYLSTPDMETLYSGLSQGDVSRMGGTLNEAGIRFDVSSDGTKVMVRPMDSAKARMLLAEKGLPTNASTGYELFDKVGSMGLTSFMQDMTRARALEGELSRSIQTLRGVRAARVHIVMPERETFRRERQGTSASVVVKLDNPTDFTSARAIRHLVSAAVPGLKLESVQVISTDGTVLASEGDGSAEAPSKMLDLERTVAKELQDRIRRTLTPYLGTKNFEASVTTKINIDKKQTTETAFDPKSKVERSLRVIKQADNSQNTTNNAAVGAEQNIPGEEGEELQGEKSKRSNERKEEVTNYEINTKTTATESLGYRLEQVTVAVLIDRKKLVEVSGGAAAAGGLDGQISEIERLVRSAVGAEDGRGDQITVTAVNFMPGANELDPIGERSLSEILLSQLGSLLRVIAIFGVAAILIIFGFRPIARALVEQSPAAATASLAGSATPSLATDAIEGAIANALPAPDVEPDSDRALLAQLSKAVGKAPSKRLEKIIDINEEQAAAILKQWVRQARA